jgi:hypothetical protein
VTGMGRVVATEVGDRVEHAMPRVRHDTSAHKLKQHNVKQKHSALGMETIGPKGISQGSQACSSTVACFNEIFHEKQTVIERFLIPV